MSKTVTSLFKSQSEAQATLSRLQQAGLSHGGINTYTSSSGDLTDELHRAGVPSSDAHAYMEGVRRGGALVTVTCQDDEVERVIDILEGDTGALDIDHEQTAWRSQGWQGHQGAQSGSGTAAGAGLGAAAGLTGGSSTGALRGTGERDEVIPVAEEELHVGKRAVNHGRVRIHSHVVERPVQEQVTLRDETVAVQRRPATGTSLSGDPFQERTIEVEEHDEQAVVSKEARVKEELVVRKDVEERTETISDTVRRTEVDVEDERSGRGTGTTGATDRSRS